MSTQDQPADRALARLRPRIRLQVGAAVLSLVTVVLAALAVHAPWLIVSRDNVAEMARQLNGEILAGVNREIAALFQAATAAQQTLRDALRDGAIDVEDKAARDRLFFAVLNANPHFSWVSFGKPNGDFYGAQRRDGVNLRIADSRWNAQTREAERVEDYFVNDGERISRTVTKTKANDYFAPARAWYRLALANPDRHVWTDVYVFDASRKPGLNTAITLSERDSAEIVGVLSVAIELERISHYLAGLTSLRSGSAFIVDRAGRLIAFPDPAEVTRPGPDPDEPELKPLAASEHPLLVTARDGLARAGTALDRLNETRQISAQDASGARFFLTVAPAIRDGWVVGTMIPEAALMAPIEANYGRVALAVLFAVLLVGALAIGATRFLLIHPLHAIMGETRKIAQFDLDRVRRVPSALIEIDALSGSIEHMSRALGSFRRYLPADLVRTLVDQGVVAELGGERRTLSVMFMDLEGFTSASERLGHRIVPLLGEYLAVMSAAIQEQRGTIDKFIGDTVMAFWGAPRYDEEHPVRACRTALECQTRMAALRADWLGRGLPAMELRIGINSGRVVVGNIGCAERLNYTVIGDPVNLAARLEAMNKEFGTGILISHHTYELAKYDVVARRLDSVRVKGKEEAVAVYELLAMRDETGAAPGFEWVALFETGADLFAARRWHDAAQQFRAVLAMKDGDRPTLTFIARCEAAIAAEARTTSLPAARAGKSDAAE